MKAFVFLLWLFILPIIIVSFTGWFFSTGNLKVGAAAFFIAYFWIVTMAPAIRYIQK